MRGFTICLRQAGLPHLVAAAIAVTACSPPVPIPLTPSKEAAGAAVVRKPIAEPPPPVVTAVPVPPAPPSIVVPFGAQYVCVSEVDGVRAQTVIEFAPRVAQLCQRHPEMGPCQYERDLCRRSGGRVYASGGVEITMLTEAEYDRTVIRVRFKSN